MAKMYLCVTHSASTNTTNVTTDRRLATRGIANSDMRLIWKAKPVYSSTVNLTRRDLKRLYAEGRIKIGKG